MSVDVEAMRQRIESYSKDGLVAMFEGSSVLPLLDEIVALRARVAELEADDREDAWADYDGPLNFDAINEYVKAMKGDITSTETRPDLAGIESDIDETDDAAPS